MTEINILAGRRAAIIRRAFSSVPMDYRFSARAAVPCEALSGSVEVKKSQWIIPAHRSRFHCRKIMPCRRACGIPSCQWMSFPMWM